MKESVQFILNEQGKPAFAVIPYISYQELIKDKDVPMELTVASTLVSGDGLKIRLPHGGPGAEIDLVKLVDYFRSTKTHCVAVNARQQALDKFDDKQLGSLDYMLRTQFLPKQSPYRNTMQATSDVVDALEQTGMFRRTKRDFEGYYRPVLALEYLEGPGNEFMKGKKMPLFRIPNMYWLHDLPA